MSMTIKDEKLGAGSQHGAYVDGGRWIARCIGRFIVLHLSAHPFRLGRGRRVDRKLHSTCTVPALLRTGVTPAFLAGGYWLVYRSSRHVCVDGAACARPLSNRLMKASLVAATLLIVAALGVDLLAPLLLNS